MFLTNFFVSPPIPITLLTILICAISGVVGWLIILVLNPLIGVVALPIVLGGFMLAGGIAAVLASFHLRSSTTTTGS